MPLDSDCPDEDALIELASGSGQRELEHHVAHCVRCRAAVAQLVTDAPSAHGASVRPTNQVSRYVVIRLAGAGAMGRMSIAFDPLLNRTIALKLLNPLNESAAARSALLSEAQALARVSHPNLVTVHDAGEADGSVFIAMELVNGSTLRAWQRQAKRSTHQIVATYRQAARGLAAMHDANLVHRDFKPDNVLIGKDGRVRVTDFGLARASTSAAVGEAGAPAGPPAFMAPEQGGSGAFDARSDQFAFCCALAEALSGVRPFAVNDRDTVSKGPSLPGVPRSLARVLRRGLELEPSLRFSTMHELIAALEPNRLVVPFAIAAVALISVIGVLLTRPSSASLCQGGQARVDSVLSPPRVEQLAAHFASLGTEGQLRFSSIRALLDRATTAWVSMYRDNCEATRVHQQPDEVFAARTHCLERRLVELDATVRVLQTTNVETLPRAVNAASALTPVRVCGSDLVTEAPADAPEHPALRPQKTAIESNLARASALYEAGRSAECEKLAEQVGFDARALPWPSKEAEAAVVRAQALDRIGSADVEPSLRQGWAAALAARDDRLAIRTAEILSLVISRQGRLAEATEWHWHAQALQGRLPKDELLEGMLAAQSGQLALMRNDFVEARKNYELAYAKALKIRGPRDRHTLLMMANLSIVSEGQHRYAESLSLRQAVLAEFTLMYGTSNDVVGRLHAAIAETLMHLHRDAEAEAVINEVLDLQTSAFGAGSVNVAELSHYKAIALRRLGRPREAEALFERALQNYEAHGLTRQQTATRIESAEALAALGEGEKALAALASARALVAKTFGPDDADITSSYESEGRVQLALHRPREALTAFSTALARRQASGDTVMYGYTLSQVGLLHQKLGQAALARDELSRAVTSLAQSGIDDESLAAAREALKR